MTRVCLSLILHSHQPVGNFESVFDRSFALAYKPFLDLLYQQPQFRVALHFSGPLLEWLMVRHPDYLLALRELVERRQVEMLSGGFYEPILAVIPDHDKIEQLHRLNRFIEDKLSVQPRGLWLAERIWEPQLPRFIAEAGLEYAVLDDTHFIQAGLRGEQLFGYYVTEDLGRTLRLIPGSKTLRYTIPFQEPEVTIDFLRSTSRDGIPSWVAMGDDLEKFGVWPKTHAHCYTKNFWFARFVNELNRSDDWLEMVLPTEYLDRHPPIGNIYLPATSYAEMGQWTLPARVSREYGGILQEIEHDLPARFRPFFSGGTWRNFLAKYPEANQMHKKMLRISRRLHTCATTDDDLLRNGMNHLLQAQCNDGYWHGVFGGLYAPHLRHAIYNNLIRAETVAWTLEGHSGPSIEVVDYDGDGQVEVLVENSESAVTVHPADGGTIAEIDFRPTATNIVNALQRRYEAYHDEVAKAVRTPDSDDDETMTIHDIFKKKEDGLERFLKYDAWLRRCFRLLVDIGGTVDRDVASGPYEFQTALVGDSARVVLRATGAFAVEKTLEVRPGGRIDFRVRLTNRLNTAVAARLGIEHAFNLLAADMDDRYFEIASDRTTLRFEGEIPAEKQIAVVDEWQRIRVALERQEQGTWTIEPIYTISNSEDGFERIYQGSNIVMWHVLDLPPAGSAEFEHTVRMTAL